MLLLSTFAAMLYVATRRIDLIVGCTAIFAGAIWWASTHFHYVQARIAVWHDPFRDPYGAGYQAIQSLFSLAAGGLFGTGYHAGRPDFIPDVATDYVYAAYTEEWGAIGAIVLCAAFLALILRMLAVAQRQPDLYAKLLATGLAATLGFPSRDHRRRRAAPLPAHRNHAAVRLVRRQLARHEFLAGRARMGNFRRASKKHHVKGVSTAFWSIVLIGSTVSIGAGFVGGRSIGSAGALPVADAHKADDGLPAPIRQRLLRRSLYGAHSLDAAGTFDPYGDPELAVSDGRQPGRRGSTRAPTVPRSRSSSSTPARVGPGLDQFVAFAAPAGAGRHAGRRCGGDGADDRGGRQDGGVDASQATPARVAALLRAGAQGVIASLDERRAAALLHGIDRNAFVVDAALGEDDDVGRTARALHRQVFVRDVIADARDDAAYVDFMLRDALAIAQRTGTAIVAVHARAASFNAISRFADRAGRDGADIVALTDLDR